MNVPVICQDRGPARAGKRMQGRGRYRQIVELLHDWRSWGRVEILAFMELRLYWGEDRNVVSDAGSAREEEKRGHVCMPGGKCSAGGCGSKGSRGLTRTQDLRGGMQTVGGSGEEDCREGRGSAAAVPGGSAAQTSVPPSVKQQLIKQCGSFWDSHK